MKLYTYHQSSAAYRVRIALNLKGMKPDEESYIDLTKNDQGQADYASVNPQKLVPSLVVGSDVLTQSIAIMEYLEEVHPAQPILPADPLARAHSRAIALAVAGDISAINNLKIRLRLKAEFGATDEDVKVKWIQHWITDGFTAIEALLKRSRFTGTFCAGDFPTIADCCLVPQMFNARRFQCDLAPFPTIVRITDACEALPAFAAAHPSKQPDAHAA